MTSTTQIPISAPTKGRFRPMLTTFGIVWATLLLFITLAVTTPGFLTSANLNNILHQQAVILIVAAPLTLTIIAGSFDVSLSAIFVVSPLVTLQVENATGSILLAVTVGIIAGALCGALNAFLVVKMKINSFIATLASSYIFFGLSYLVSQKQILAPSEPTFRSLATGRFLGLTSATWIAIVVVIIFWILLARTRYGRYVYATGANSEAAVLSGVRTGRIVASTFVLVGAAAGLSGILNASQSMSARASDDFTFVFSVLAAVVVGGTSIMGGSGAVWRSLVGAMFIAMIGNGFNLNQLDPILQRIVLGLVILLAVSLDILAKLKRRAR